MVQLDLLVSANADVNFFASIVSTMCNVSEDAQIVAREHAAHELLQSEKRGRAAYDAYALATGGRTFDGLGMASWGDLPERIRVAWIEAAEAALAIGNGVALDQLRSRA